MYEQKEKGYLMKNNSFTVNIGVCMFHGRDYVLYLPVSEYTLIILPLLMNGYSGDDSSCICNNSLNILNKIMIGLEGCQVIKGINE